MRKNNFSSGWRTEDSEQGYLASVSDMMSGLMFIFIITLMIFVIRFNQERVEAATEKQALEITRDGLVVAKQALEATQDSLTDAKEVRKQLLEDMQRSLENRGIRVQIDIEKGLLHVPEDILFESGRASFLKGGEETLAVLALNLVKQLPCYSGSRDAVRPPICSPEKFKPGRLEAVLVEGHTDNVPIHNKRYSDNWALSAKRSIVTYKVLMDAAPELEQMLNGEGEVLFGVSGYAATRPVVAYDRIQAEPRNRRIDLRFILASPKVNNSEN